MPSSLIAAAVTYVTAAWAAVSFTAVATFAAKVALTIGISKLLANRTGTTAQGTQDAGGRVQLPPATDNKLPVVYGRAYISPIITDAIISSDQTTMWYVCSLCEVTGIGAINFEEVWIDGKRATLGTVDATRVLSLTTNSNPPQVDTKIDGNMNLYFYNNGSNQPANTGLTAIQVLQDSTIPANKRWTNTDTMSNTAFFIAKIKYNRDAGTTGLPTFTIKVRNDTKSPGEVLVDYLSNTRYGCGIPFSRIDEPSFGQLDVYSSQQITYYPPGGGVATQNRYVINGPLNTGVNCLTNLQQLCDACDSWLQYSELTGKWKVVINKAYTQGPNPQTLNSLFSVDSSNLIGGIEINPIDLNSTYNVMEIQYPNTNILDQTDYQIISLSDSGKPWYKPQLLSPNEPVNKLTIQLPQVNNYVQAIYLGVRRLLQTREDLIINFSTDYSGIQVEAGDVIKVSHEQYGWVDKLFRVSQVSEQKTLDGFLGARITAFEYNSTVYADDAFTNFIPEANTGLTDPNIFGVVDPPVVTYVGGGTIPQMTVIGVAPTTGSAIAIDFNYGTSSNSATHTVYTTVTSGAGTPFAPGENVTINVTDLAAGNYYWSITARNIDAGRRSTSNANVVAWPGPSVTTWDPISNTGGITSNNFANNSVVVGKIANNAVTSVTISANAVIAGKIAANAVTAGTIAANAVTAGTIAAGAITADSLGANSITANNLQANSVIAGKIAANAVTAGTIAAGAITADSLGANSITANNLQANSVIAGKIAAGAVTAGTIAANAVTSNTIAANAITTITLAANSITSDKIAANAITTNTLAANSVTTAQLLIGSVTQAKSTVAPATLEPVAWYNWPTAPLTWPNNTRGIVPAGGATIVPQTSPINSANTQFQEGSRLQIGFTVQIYSNANPEYNLIELWKSGASTTYDRGFNTIRHSYNLGTAFTSNLTQLIFAYGFGAYDLYSSDGGSTWSSWIGNTTTNTITGAINFRTGATNTPYTIQTYNVGPLQTNGNNFVCFGERQGTAGVASSVNYLDLDSGIIVQNQTQFYDLNCMEYAQTGSNGTSSAFSEAFVGGTNGQIWYEPTVTSSTSFIPESTGGTLQPINSIYGNELNGTLYTACACGGTGTILRSSRTRGTTTSWSSRPTYIGGNVSTPLLSALYSIAGDDSIQSSTSKWVAVGQYGMIQVSVDDGDTWTQVTGPVTSSLNAVRWCNGSWVIVGDGGIILTATNPLGTWTQINTGLTDRNLFTIDYSPAHNTINIGGQSIILNSAAGINPSFSIVYSDSAAETYNLTRVTYFGSWPLVNNTSLPPAQQRVVNGSVFSTSVIDTDYIQGQETTYYLVVGNMQGSRVYVGQAYLLVQEIKR